MSRLFVVRLCNKSNLQIKYSSLITTRSISLSSEKHAAGGGHGPPKMVIRPSQYQWKQYWDDFHFYFCLTAVPLVAGITLFNIFVGDSQLVDTPEDYEPHFWEYYKHPITRFLCKWMFQSPQETYERKLAVREMKRSKEFFARDYRTVKHAEKIRGDYRGFYFVPIHARAITEAYQQRLYDEHLGRFTQQHHDNLEFEFLEPHLHPTKEEAERLIAEQEERRKRD